MSVVFESKTAIVTYLDSGHMLHTDRATGELFRSHSTWKDYESAKSAYHDLTSSEGAGPALGLSPSPTRLAGSLNLWQA